MNTEERDYSGLLDDAISTPTHKQTMLEELALKYIDACADLDSAYEEYIQRKRAKEAAAKRFAERILPPEPELNGYYRQWIVINGVEYLFTAQATTKTGSDPHIISAKLTALPQRDPYKD